MNTRVDALIIGGGPAGTSAAVWLATAGWRVMLVEQHRFPRQKVCGECLAATAFPILDELGVGQAVRDAAGVPLANTGWMDANRQLLALMPQCPPPDAYGRALGRDVFDSILMARAHAAGVDIRQPARVVAVRGQPGDYHCDIESHAAPHALSGAAPNTCVAATVIIDAHGSWERGPQFLVTDAPPDPAQRAAAAPDLFAFKATFHGSSLAPGFLPVFGLNGGYGGMVVANDGRTTLALCIRRDQLRKIRLRNRGVAAGVAVEQHLRSFCRGIRDALLRSERDAAWLAVGPLRPGIRMNTTPGIYPVGNAAGEAHPLVGEGMCMALQSAQLLTGYLLRHAARGGAKQQLHAVTVDYATSWRRLFASRLRISSCYAHIAMRPLLSTPVGSLLNRWPGLLTTAAVFAGKVSPALSQIDQHRTSA